METKFNFARIYTWLGTQASKFQYPTLSSIVRQKQATVAQVLGSKPLNVSFKEHWLEWKYII